MNPAMTFCRWAAFVAMVLLAVGITPDLGATAPEPHQIFTGMVGLVRGQTARLNATNAGDGIHAPTPCQVTLLLLGSQGQMLAGPNELLLQPGASFSLELALTDPIAPPPGRLQVRGVVKTLCQQKSMVSPIRATLEIFDSPLGVTTVLQPPGACFPAGAVLPPRQFGLVGLTPGQTARLSLVNLEDRALPRTPCKLQLLFLDAQGTVLKQVPLEGPLEPGAATFADLNAEGLPPGRHEIQAQVQLDCPGGAARPLAALPTMEVFDNLTGKTTIIQYPATSCPVFSRSAVPPVPIQVQFRGQ